MLQPGRYIASLYDDKWYIGIIMDRCDENNDVKVKFMRRDVCLGMSMTINVGFHFNISSVLLQHHNYKVDVVGSTL